MRFGPGLGGWLEGRHRTRGFARNIMLPVIHQDQRLSVAGP
jgi:hypothetical protein